MIKNVLKIAGVFMCVFYLYTLGVVLLEGIVDETNSKNKADLVNACDTYYYEGEYGELRDYLLLYDAFDETFDKYWEIVDGYADYVQYEQWKATNGADKKVEEYKQKVTSNYQNCQFETNKNVLKKYYEEINDN